MRKDFGAKPLLYPQPVLIIATYGEDGTPDAMNAAWGGISESNQVTMCLSAEHKTVKNILARGAFTISMGMLLMWWLVIMWGLYPATTSLTRWPERDSTPPKANW